MLGKSFQLMLFLCWTNLLVKFARWILYDKASTIALHFCLHITHHVIHISACCEHCCLLQLQMQTETTKGVQAGRSWFIQSQQQSTKTKAAKGVWNEILGFMVMETVEAVSATMPFCHLYYMNAMWKVPSRKEIMNYSWEHLELGLTKSETRVFVIYA